MKKRLLSLVAAGFVFVTNAQVDFNLNSALKIHYEFGTEDVRCLRFFFKKRLGMLGNA